MRKRSARRSQLFVEALEARDLLSVAAPSSLLVKLAPNFSLQAAEARLLAPGGGYSVQPTGMADLYTVSAGPDQLNALAKLAASEPFVQYVEPNGQVHADLVPNDPSFTNNTLYGLNGTWGINAPAAWDATTGSTSVIVADLDTGIDYDHPDLYENIWINQAEIPPERLANLHHFDANGNVVPGPITFYDLNYFDPATRTYPNQGPGKITDVNGDGRIDASDLLAPMDVDASGNDLGTGGWVNPLRPSTRDGDTAHPDDLVGWNFVNNTNNPYDDNSHGTHTAGILGAVGNNGTGVVGVNWQVQIMPIKFEDAGGNGSDANAINAIEYSILHGARVSSNSWNGADDPQSLYNAIGDARQAGQVFVAAAGNTSENTDIYLNYPSSFNLPNIIAVAATDSNGNLAGFSSYGPTTVDVGAPGVNIYSTLPNGDYGDKTGTSMATPFVAGVAALVLAQHPTWTYSQVVSQIVSTATPDPALAGKTVSGGIVNALGAVQVQGGDLNWSGGGLANIPLIDPGTPFALTRSYTVSGVDAPSNFGIAYYASTSADPNQNLANATFLGEEIISASADKTMGTHYGTSIPLTVATSGDSYLIAKLDPGNVIVETDESNNAIVTNLNLATVQVRDGDTEISNAGSDAFGNTYAGTPVTRTFTVTNAGSQTITLGALGTMPVGFTLTQDFGTKTLAAGASTTFQVRLDATSVGSYSGTLSFTSSDPNFSFYSWSISGTVAPPTVQIGDDSSGQVFSTTGSWTAYSGSGPMYDGNMHYAPTGTGANVATWTFTVTPGQFRVSSTWWAWAGRASNAPYTVLDGSTSKGTVLVNQQLDPGGFIDHGSTWQDLGMFTILANQLVVQLSDNANGYVIADAIRIERLGNAATVQVQDGATQIASGGSDLFGTTTVGTPVTRTLTVKNAGTQAITLGALGTMPAGFTLTQGFGTTTLTAGASTTFQVRLDATVVGSHSGTLWFTTSDPNCSSYNWSVSGAVQAVSTAQFGDDSSSQEFSTTGSWTAYSGSGPMFDGNMHYAAAGTGTNVATWTFTVTPGQFRVSTTWWAWSNRASNAPYTVLDGTTSLGTILINQQLDPSGFSDQGSTWQDLGTFTIIGNQLVVKLSDNANGYVIADAIRIESLGNAPTVQVQDNVGQIVKGGVESFGTTTVGTPVTRTFTVTNAGTQTITLGALGIMPAGFTLTQDFGTTTLAAGASTTFQVRLDATVAGSYSGTLSFTSSDPNFSSYSWSVSGTVQAVSTVQIGDDDSSQGFAMTGSWATYSGSGPMYAGNMHYAPAGTGVNVATWTFTVTPGQYRVSATWWAWSNRAGNAPYTVLDGSTSQGTFLVNQQLAPLGFNDQGSTWQDLGTFTIVGNQLVVQLSDNANGYVIADAIRIEKVG